MFDFNKLKFTLSDTMVLGLSTSSIMLDYYSKSADAKKKQDIDKFNQKVILENQVARENGISYNTYLANKAIEAQSMNTEMSIQRNASEAVASGAAAGMEGAALQMLVRQTQADRLRADGASQEAKMDNMAKAQVQLDAGNLEANQQMQKLAYSTTDDVSIFPSLIKTGKAVVSAIDASEKARQQEEYYKLIGTPKTSGTFQVGIK